MDRQPLTDDAADGTPRVQRRIRVLKNDLHPSPQLTHLSRRQFQHRLAVEMDGTGRGFFQPQDQSPQGGFSAAAFAHQAKGFTPQDGHVHPIDGLDQPLIAAEQATPDREILLHSFEDHQRIVC